MSAERSRQFDHQQEQTLARLKARIPAEVPLLVERLPADVARQTFRGFKVTGPGCEIVGRAQVVTAFVDGFVAAWRCRDEVIETVAYVKAALDLAERLLAAKDAELLRASAKVEELRERIADQDRR